MYICVDVPFFERIFLTFLTFFVFFLHFSHFYPLMYHRFPILIFIWYISDTCVCTFLLIHVLHIPEMSVKLHYYTVLRWLFCHIFTHILPHFHLLTLHYYTFLRCLFRLIDFWSSHLYLIHSRYKCSTLLTFSSSFFFFFLFFFLIFFPTENEPVAPCVLDTSDWHFLFLFSFF